MADDLQVVYTAQTANQAELLKMLLAQCGIEAFVYGGESTHHSATRVRVRSADQAAAALLAADFDQQLRAQADATSLDDDPQAENHEEADERPDGERLCHADASPPTCPRCEKPRTAVCPICGTTGDDFSAADPNYEDSLVPISGLSPACTADESPCRAPAAIDRTLICSMCDEPFRAQYARCCERCGHDFGEGVAITWPTAADEASSNNSRAIWLLAILALLALALLAYFSLLPSVV